MKSILLTLALFFTDSTSAQSVNQYDDMSWLENEWNKEYVTSIDEVDMPCSKVFIVNMDGEVLMELDMPLIENKLLTDIQFKAYTTSDFMFESSTGDEYYLAH